MANTRASRYDGDMTSPRCNGSAISALGTYIADGTRVHGETTRAPAHRSPCAWITIVRTRANERTSTAFATILAVAPRLAIAVALGCMERPVGHAIPDARRIAGARAEGPHRGACHRTNSSARDVRAE